MPTTRSQRRAQLSLPAELILHIILLAAQSTPVYGLRCDEEEQWVRNARDERLDLLSRCALVCRAWRPLAQGELFRCVRLEEYGLERFAATIQQDARTTGPLAGYVRSLHIGEDDDASEEKGMLARLCKNLRYFHLSRLVVDATFRTEATTCIVFTLCHFSGGSHFGNIRRLDLYNCTFPEDTFTEASLRHVVILKIFAYSSHVPLRAMRQVLSGVAPSLKALSITIRVRELNYDKYSLADVLDLFQRFDQVILVESPRSGPGDSSPNNLSDIVNALPHRLATIFYHWKPQAHCHTEYHNKLEYVIPLKLSDRILTHYQLSDSDHGGPPKELDKLKVMAKALGTDFDTSCLDGSIEDRGTAFGAVAEDVISGRESR